MKNLILSLVVTFGLIGCEVPKQPTRTWHVKVLNTDGTVLVDKQSIGTFPPSIYVWSNGQTEVYFSEDGFRKTISTPTSRTLVVIE